MWVKKDSIINTIKIKQEEELQCDDDRLQQEFENSPRKRQRTNAPAPTDQGGLLLLQQQPHYDITKKLTCSDVNENTRLLMPIRDTKAHILPHLNEEWRRDVRSKEGTKLDVYDVDTSSTHIMTFKRGKIGYVFNDGWSSEFVRRRKLHEYGVIGMSWDGNRSCFVFSVISRPSDYNEDQI